MTNIEHRIVQILIAKEPLTIKSLINEIKTVAYKEDKAVLDDNRIINRIKLQLKNGKIIQDDEHMLYMNTPQNMTMIHKKLGITIKHYPSGQEVTLGAPGIKMCAGTVMTLGDTNVLTDNPNGYFMVLDVDLPLRLELNEQLSNPYEIKVNGKAYNLFHKIKKRGEEDFSCLNTNYLPYFSSLQITTYTDDEIIKSDKVKLLYSILLKLNSILNDKMLNECINYNVNIPFRYVYFDKNSPEKKQITYNIVFLTVDINILGKTIENEYPKEELRKLLNSEKFVLQNKIENEIKTYNSINNFSEKIFRLTHDFSYYIRQTPEVFSNMKEENLRDVYLFCTRVGTEYSCEAEAFNYDGKADFKIKPSNSYEYIIGEFKWWKGQKSIEELCMQGFEKHVTGQEKDIYLILLNNNKDINGPKEKSLKYIRNREEIISEFSENILPTGSKEYFYKFKAKIKNNDVNVIFTIIDLSYERV